VRLTDVRRSVAIGEVLTGAGQKGGNGTSAREREAERAGRERAAA
jgi:hypothetical protein